MVGESFSERVVYKWIKTFFPPFLIFDSFIYFLLILLSNLLTSSVNLSSYLLLWSSLAVSLYICIYISLSLVKLNMYQVLFSCRTFFFFRSTVKKRKGLQKLIPFPYIVCIYICPTVRWINRSTRILGPPTLPQRSETFENLWMLAIGTHRIDMLYSSHATNFLIFKTLYLGAILIRRIIGFLFSLFISEQKWMVCIRFTSISFSFSVLFCSALDLMLE